MERKWLARMSMLLSMAMVAGLVGIWRASARAASPLVTIGVDLASASLDRATYELVVTNRGNAEAKTIRVTDTIPKGTRFVSARPAPAPDSDCLNGGARERPRAVCRWNVGPLAPGADSRIRLRVDIAPIRSDRSVATEALAAYGTQLSRHVNDRLHLTTSPVDGAPGCTPRSLSAAEVRNLVSLRSLTGGRRIARMLDARVACSEAGTPRLVAAAEAAAVPTCVDVDPEAASGPANAEVALTALVTDGTATERTGTAEDSCSGVAQNNINVIFTIEDDDPDAYISRVEPFPTQGQPNTQTGTTDQSGRTDIGVRLVSPAPSTDGNRVSGRIDGTQDVPEEDSSLSCGVPPPLGPGPCPGQAANEDDVAVTWAGTGATGSPSPTGTSTAAPTGSPSPAPTATGTASPRPTTTGTARPTATASRSPSPGQSARTVTLFTSSSRTVHGRRITLSGQVFSSNATCDDVGETVRVRKRVHGESAFVDAGAASTDIDGRFSVTLQALQNADYVAVAPAHDQCAEATSPSVTTLVKVKVSAKPSSQRVSRGAGVRITGKVVPKHSGNVKLQRKKGRRWVGAGRARLTNRGAYVFRLNASWGGRRAFRVVWPSQDDDHEKGTSKKVVIRST